MAIEKDALPAWQLKILQQLDSRLAKHFVADDPDYLLAEESLQKALSENGFNLYFYEGSIELRHFLSIQLAGETGSCVISIDSDRYDLNALPYDLLLSAQRLSVSLGDCFPDISYSVLKSLQVEELNALDAAIEEYAPGQMNESAGSDFVLRHVFKLASEVIQTPSDLLRSLLRLHYRDVALPDLLKSRLIDLLTRRKQFVQWPLGDIVSSKQCFFTFLQRHWSAYIDEVIESLEQGIKEPAAVYQVSGDAGENVVLPFGHDDVRIYIDNLFLEGYLTPIELDSPDRLIDHWCLVGVLQDPDKELRKRIEGLLRLCNETLPGEDDRHQQWQQYACRWGELSAHYHSNKSHMSAFDTFVEDYSDLQQKVDQQFSDWMLGKYTGLHNHPPVPPVMLHHVPRAMERELDSKPDAKAALIVVDGLSIDQWVTIKAQFEIDGVLNESAIFAWVPTVTSVSRQALFSAKAPYQFAKTIGTTSSEPKAWEQFWLDTGLDKSQVYYKKSLGTDDVDALIDQLSDRRLRAVGLVINTVDDMMHGMQLGAAGMHNQVKLWAEGAYLQQLITALLDKGFSVHLTSDHGNVEAVGSGKVKEGAVAESRGERVRVYKTEVLRDSISFDPIDAVAWSRTGLPKDYWPMVMKGRKAFVAKDEKIVGHGGIAIEEVVVPYITVRRELNEK
ncbi:MAG: BREX-3 system phosphatase PglZ [Gammaproteobacteria bacterium]|nr:BREX-3 system phosphatase PglZ [Gammaproteobacteria bacterium]